MLEQFKKQMIEQFNPGGSDYEKSNDFEEKSDSLSNEEQQKSEKKIIKKFTSDNEKKKILKKFLEKKERLANEFGKQSEIGDLNLEWAMKSPNINQKGCLMISAKKLSKNLTK
uniref:Uncharacterized protein n=1 Tax=Globodera pallida TaxID=36090 RepID=A0A183BZ53_GLOPA